jgi:hypothetical protein
MLNKYFVNVPSSDSTVVVHLPFYLKVEGLCPGAPACTGKEKMRVFL